MCIQPEQKDLGGFSVRRVLPAPHHQMVGPFIFFDHLGPATFPAGEGIQVRPHPHIGLSTVTYLFDGELVHRDSLGSVQTIRPGAVNLMTAGRGIVHSERAGDDFEIESTTHALQIWIALPDAEEEREPSFIHYPFTDLPATTVDDVDVRVIMGSAYGLTSPVTTYSPTLYVELKLSQGAQIALPSQYLERAFYVVEGCIAVGSQTYPQHTMAIVQGNQLVELQTIKDSHVMLIGGAPVGQRHVWWNFVSSSMSRIEKAKANWKEKRFANVPGETEFIPLPD
jgi:redox-sensitive bicupin YhaK (pirin superfamily)